MTGTVTGAGETRSQSSCSSLCSERARTWTQLDTRPNVRCSKCCNEMWGRVKGQTVTEAVLSDRKLRKHLFEKVTFEQVWVARRGELSDYLGESIPSREKSPTVCIQTRGWAQRPSQRPAGLLTLENAQADGANERRRRQGVGLSLFIEMGDQGGSWADSKWVQVTHLKEQSAFMENRSWTSCQAGATRTTMPVWGWLCPGGWLWWCVELCPKW